jgi:hypothetical protein
MEKKLPENLLATIGHDAQRETSRQTAILRLRIFQSSFARVTVSTKFCTFATKNRIWRTRFDGELRRKGV